MVQRFISDEQLDSWVAYHPPGSPAVIAAHERIRVATRGLLDVLQDVLPECPDKAVALRAAVSAMWAANACVACNHPDNQQGGPS